MHRRRFLTFAGATLGDTTVAGYLGSPEVVSEAPVYDLVFDPYERVDWAGAYRLKTQLHSHTINDRRGGLDAHTLVDAHAVRGFDALAISDKSQSPHVWSWEAFDEIETHDRAGEWEPRDPNEVGMVAIEGMEQTDHHHVLSLFCQYTDRREPEPEDTIEVVDGIGEAGGIAILAHPSIHDARLDVADYAPLFRGGTDEVYNRHHCLGLEAYHRKDVPEYEDEALWDSLIAEFAPSRPIFGFATDDGTTYAWGRDFDRHWIDVFAADASTESLREALETGAFTATQRGVWDPDGDPDEERTEPQVVPSINRITVDHDAAEISVDADNCQEMEWIIDGNVIETGETFDWTDEDHTAALDTANYVRMKLTAGSALTATQPFLFEKATDHS